MGAGEKRGEGRRCSNCLLTMPAPVAQSLAPCILMTSEEEIVMQRVLCHKLQQQAYIQILKEAKPIHISTSRNVVRSSYSALKFEDVNMKRDTSY
ncbi:hypothetical protein AAZX31_02G078600 [Glycine max]